MTETPTGSPAAQASTGSPAPRAGAAQRLAHRLLGLGPVRLTALTAVVVGIAVIVILSFPSGGGQRHAPAAPARNFSLGALGDPQQRISLSSLAGRPVIVNFFASWCVPCRKETPLLARFYRARHGAVKIIGIDVNDQASSALAFVRRNGVTYPVATEPATGTTIIDYDLPGLPATFFLDSRHRIVKRVYGAVTQAELTSGAALINERAK
ncbi:MAG TPA: TlpA disulfide reductase family protein [Streptosporangiaceae bacterium]|nr:TlpA disulfide reductase family protein [Streptosporangiaceae bacterium]